MQRPPMAQIKPPVAPPHSAAPIARPEPQIQPHIIKPAPEPSHIPRGVHKELSKPSEIPKPDASKLAPPFERGNKVGGLPIPSEKKHHKPNVPVVTSPEGPISIANQPELKQVQPAQPITKKPPVVLPQSGQNVAPTGSKDAKKHHQHHHHHDHDHRNQLHDLDGFFVAPFIGDYSYYAPYDQDESYVDSYPYEEEEAPYVAPGAENIYVGFYQRYSAAMDSGELYVDASEISSNKQIELLQNIDSLDLTVGNADNDTFKRLLAVTNLESLKLTGSKVTMIPQGISKLDKLQWLDLSNNQITVVPAEIGDMKSLEQLILNGNPIRSIPPEIGKLSGLQGLYLANTRLASLPTEVANLTQLKALDLSGNRSGVLEKPVIKQWVNKLIRNSARVKS